MLTPLTLPPYSHMPLLIPLVLIPPDSLLNPVFPGIVKSDPKLPEDAIFSLPPPRPKNVIFEDEEKSKVRADHAQCDPCGGGCGRKQYLAPAEYTEPHASIRIQ